MQIASTAHVVHDLSLEAAKITFATNNADQKLTPAQIAAALLTAYLEARTVLVAAWDKAESTLV